MSRWLCVLWVAACGGTVHPPSNRGAAPDLELGAFMTPTTDPHGDGDNQLYVFAAQERGQTVLGVVCRAPCLPHVPRPYRYKPEAYRSESVRLVAPRIWEGTMRAEVAQPKSIKPATFTMRLDLSTTPPSVSFGGHTQQLHRASFHKHAYQYMGEHGERQPMLFVNSAEAQEILIKPVPDGRTDDTFLYLAPNSPVVHTVRSRNWSYRFAAPKATPELVGAYYSVLHGELVLPQGEATFDLDEVRSPANDVSMGVTRAGKTVRFQQTNDSNTHQYEHCAAGACRTLITAADVKATCGANRLAIWFDTPTSARLFSLDDKDNLLDAQCKVAYGYKYVDDTKVVLTEPNGRTIELAKRADPP